MAACASPAVASPDSPTRRLSSVRGVHHAVATCRDCGWESQDYRTAQANARQHARRKGHRVQVDVGVSYYYDGSQRR